MDFPREHNGRFRRRRLRRKKKRQQDAQAAIATPAKPTSPPAAEPGAKPPPLEWPADEAPELSRDELKAALDELGVDYDARTPTTRLRVLLERETAPSDGDSG